MKKLLLIGNKPLDKDYSSIIDDYDMVVRVNRMLNYNQSKGKTDLWLADVHTPALFESEDKEKFLEARNAILPYISQWPTIKFLSLIGYKGGKHIIKFDSLNIKKCIPNYSYGNGFRITNSIWMLIYCLENFADEYEIHTLGIGNRYFLNSEEHYYHKNIYQEEENFIEGLLESGKIKSYDFDLPSEGKWELLGGEIRIPILIPIKEHSKRCPNKNKTLLPFTLNWLKSIGRINDAVVITDSDTFIDITKNYKISDYHVEKRDENQDELTSLYKYAFEKGIDKFIFLPVTQPLREKDLISRMLEFGLSECDMVMSYGINQDRSIYEIDGEKIKIEGEKKGCMCQEKMAADGACYYLSKDFITKVVQSESPNKTFWGGNIKFILNNMPQLDIDNEIDIKRLNNLVNILK